MSVDHSSLGADAMRTVTDVGNRKRPGIDGNGAHATLVDNSA